MRLGNPLKNHTCEQGDASSMWPRRSRRTFDRVTSEDLVARANERGGHDNITEILIRVPKQRPSDGLHRKGFFRSLLGQ